MNSISPSIPFLFTPPYSLFSIPAGNYRGVLRSVSTEESKFEEGKLLLRFVFDIVAGVNGPVNYSACLEYPQDKKGHAKLSADLTAFLDPGEIDQMLGMPAEIDLSELVGTEVDMTVATFTSTDEPHYSRVMGIYPAGSVVTGDMMALGEDRLVAEARGRWKAPLNGSTLIEIPTTPPGRNRR